MPEKQGSVTLSSRQRLTARYLTFVLVDLCVLNLFAQYWERIWIKDFTTSLLVAIVLQITLKLTLALKHRIASFFRARPGAFNKGFKWFGIWLVSFFSKFVILGLIDLLFGAYVKIDGVPPFFALVIAILVTEGVAMRVFWAGFLQRNS